MDSMIYFGNNIDIHMDKQTTENMGNYIATVFREGHSNRIDQSTIVEAIKMMPRVVEKTVEASGPNGATIRDCHLEGGKLE